MNRILIPAVITVSLIILSCKSVYEKQGDKHIANNDGLSALQRYIRVEKENKGSKDFPKNLTKAYILALKQTADSISDPEIILTYREKITEKLSSLSDNKIEKLYLETIVKVAEKLYNIPDQRFRRVCRFFIMDAHKYGAEGAILSKLEWIGSEVTRLELEQEENLKEVDQMEIKLPQR